MSERELTYSRKDPQCFILSIKDPSFLTQRQAQVLNLLIKGKCNREIASKLSVAEHTVKIHLSNLFKIAGLIENDRTKLIWELLQKDVVGLLELPVVNSNEI